MNKRYRILFLNANGTVTLLEVSTEFSNLSNIIKSYDHEGCTFRVERITDISDLVRKEYEKS
jgi:hypothetical protein